MIVSYGYRYVVFVALLGTLLATLWFNAPMGQAGEPAVVSLDFSTFPSGPPVLHNVNSWSASGWIQGTGLLRLLYAGSFVELSFKLNSVPSNSQLTLLHRSAYAPGCVGQGYAPVTISINGYAIAHDYAPPSSAAVDGWASDTWSLAYRLRVGTNYIRLTAGTLCGAYELRRMEIGVPAFVGPDIVAYQFTHGIEDSAPVDWATQFSPVDTRAVLWVSVHDQALGKRLAYTFYDPAGQVYFSGDRSATKRNWFWIAIRDARAASLLGTWRVEVTIGGEMQLRVHFSIGDAPYTGSAPRVTFVDMPDTIEANGKNHCGVVGFIDREGDLSYANFEVVQGLFFADFGYAPKDVAGVTNGTFDLCVWSRIPQTVTLSLTLRDALGHTSAPYEFTFRAVPSSANKLVTSEE